MIGFLRKLFGLSPAAPPKPPRKMAPSQPLPRKPLAERAVIDWFGWQVEYIPLSLAMPPLNDRPCPVPVGALTLRRGKKCCLITQTRQQPYWRLFVYCAN